MSKVPVIKPFNIAEYASRNKFNVSKPISIGDESKVYFLSKANRLQCFKVDKEGQVISAVGAGGPTHNLIDTMVGIIEKLCKGKSV